MRWSISACRRRARASSPPDDLDQAEAFHPLRVLVCDQCWLVQLREYVSAEEIFGREYAYFSSFSTSWVEHARRLLRGDARPARSGPDSLVVELASNDGYLLQHFLPLGVPVLGIEPAPNVAAKAIEIGVPTRVEFFGRELADRLVAEGARRRSDRRQQRPGPGARPERLRRRHRPPAEAAGRRDARVPASRAHAGRQPVRPVLPRALLLLLADRGREDRRRPRPAAVRRRGAGDPWRLAAGVLPAG